MIESFVGTPNSKFKLETEIKKLDSGNISKVKKSISNMGKVISEMESLITLESTEEDRDNYSIFENLKDFIDSGVLSQVLENPENVSKNTLSGSNLPSTLKGKKNNSLSKEIKNKWQWISFAIIFGIFTFFILSFIILVKTL